MFVSVHTGYPHSGVPAGEGDWGGVEEEEGVDETWAEDRSRPEVVMGKFYGSFRKRLKSTF